jgi:TolB-like protein/Flp pilus assembly protein TadD
MPLDLTFSHFVLRTRERQLLADGKPVTLGARAFDVLCALVERAGELVSKTELFELVWPGLIVEENNLQVHISTLRKLLGPELIATVPGRGYRFTGSVGGMQNKPAVGARLPAVTAARSIAVLPFVNLSDDPEQEYFSDGLAEDIISKLSRSSWLFVIARNSSFAYRQPSLAAAEVCRALATRYLVTGTVRRSGAVVRITADLVDGHTNETLWSQRFDRPLADLFEVQNQISTNIVCAIEPVYLRREEQRTSQNEVPDIQFWEHLMRARWHFWRTTRDNIDPARACLAKALEAKPDDPQCLALMSFTHMSKVWAGLATDPKQEIFEANRLALRAVGQDDTCSYAHFTLGTALSCAGNLPQAIAEMEHALELYPQFAAAAGELGRLLAFSGRTDEAVEYILQAMDSSPHDPHLSLWVRTRAIACFVDGDYAGAVKYAYQATAKRPDRVYNYYLLAATQAASGDLEEARKSLAQGQRDQLYNLQVLRIGHPFADERLFNLFAENLRKAGWAG